MHNIDMNRLPVHVAIIMDGNGRWAVNRGQNRIEGHRVGVESVRVIVRTCRKIGIKFLTLYAFSTENWGRPRPEVEGLMKILSRYLRSELNELVQNDIKLNALGDLEKLPPTPRRLLRETMDATKDRQGMVLSLALSYGGRSEILQACRVLAEECRRGLLDPARIDDREFSRRLFTADIPDPDLLIRTGGESRISNFLLWQIAYSEILVTPTFWPDFREEQLFAALADYQGRQRRFGQTGEQVESQGEEKKEGAK
ncbi:MAG: isoprenyl transferase [Pseudomonadota bacterium]